MDHAQGTCPTSISLFRIRHSPFLFTLHEIRDTPRGGHAQRTQAADPALAIPAQFRHNRLLRLKRLDIRGPKDEYD